MEELENKILELVKAQHQRTGGANGVDFNEVDEILQMPIKQRNEFLQKLVDAKKIRIGDPLNARALFMPK